MEKIAGGVFCDLIISCEKAQSQRGRHRKSIHFVRGLLEKQVYFASNNLILSKEVILRNS